MHLHGAGRRNKGNSIWIGLIMAGAIIVVTIDAIIKLGWLALAPYGFGAFIILGSIGVSRRWSDLR
jgi:hypothetical protein